MNYKINKNFRIDCGFDVSFDAIHKAILSTNSIIADLPINLYKSIDYKTTSAMIGAIFCDTLTNFVSAIVNPIEKGHPDIVPMSAKDCSEAQLRNYPEGLEIKCTIGNVKTGSNLKAGQTRINSLSGITWQAHHREVAELLGLVWDFPEFDNPSFNYPAIIAAFYSNNLTTSDWGEISGTTGRNTKVTGMSASGKQKMGEGWIALLDNPLYIQKYQRFLRFNI